MTEKLLRSHSLEKSKGADGITTSGSFSFWEDSPLSPLDIGDEFQPVPGGPTLKVGKVSISDSVVGERFGRPFRQWQITVEGDSNVQSEDDTGDSNVKYTFLIEKGDDGITKRTGTMEVTNNGASPSISIQVGGNFNVPGVGSVTCTKVNGIYCRKLSPCSMRIVLTPYISSTFVSTFTPSSSQDSSKIEGHSSSPT